MPFALFIHSQSMRSPRFRQRHRTKRLEPILARNGICPPSTYQHDSPVVRKRPNTDFTPNLNPVIAQSRPLRIQYTTPATEQTLNEESLMPVIVNKNFFTQCL